MNNEKEKQYRLYAVNIAIEILRPGARYTLGNNIFSSWDDPRPKPSWEEINETMEKLKTLEDSLNTIWLTEEEKKQYEFRNIDVSIL